MASRVLVFDPFAGISGDMILGALVDLGLSSAWLADFAGSLRLGPIRVEVGTADRLGISCRRVEFQIPSEHRHRHLRDVLEIVEGSSAPRPTKALAGKVFRRLAEAEASIHGVSVEAVHFHEVGALDAILDVLCVAAGIAELGFDECYTRPVALGTGWVDMQHGRFPLPAPAALKLLEGLVVRETDFAGECTTPTGAALLSTLVDGRRCPEEFIPLRSGYGAGERDPKDRPNCLRLIAGELLAAREEAAVFVIQADLDDQVPEYLPAAQQALLDAGALDATVHAVTMKKGRPGWRVEALAPGHKLDQVLESLLSNTSTIGARYWPVNRQVLARVEELVEWRGQAIRCKRVHVPGGPDRWKPEYDDVILAARTLGLAPYQVRLAMEKVAPGGAEAQE